MNMIQTGQARTSIDIGRERRAALEGERVRARLASLEQACRLLHAAELQMWGTVEQLQESLATWLSYPDVAVQRGAGEMLSLIENTLARVVQRGQGTAGRSVVLATASSPVPRPRRFGADAAAPAGSANVAPGRLLAIAGRRK